MSSWKSLSSLVLSNLPYVGVTALVHPFEIMKVSTIMNPDAPLSLEPLTDVTAYQRGLAPHLVETVVIGAARAFLTPHVTQFCRSLGPNEVDAVHLPPWRVQLSRWLSSNGPHLIVQNLVMVLTYPLILTTTVACIPSLSKNMSMVSVLKSTYERHGIMGLFSGLLAKCLGASLHSILLMPVCQWIYSKMMDLSMSKISNHPRQEQGTMVRNAQRLNLILSSAIGSVLSCITLIPFEVVATEMQFAAMLAHPLPSTMSIARLVFQKYGTRVFYMGAVPQLFKHLINASVFAYIIAKKPSNN